MIHHIRSYESARNSGKLKQGSGSDVFINEEKNIAEAFYRYSVAQKDLTEESAKYGNSREDTDVNEYLPGKLKIVKQLFYTQKILSTLFPVAYAQWHAAGMNTEGQVGNVREIIRGKDRLEYPHKVIQLERIKRIFDSHGLSFSFDFIGNNMIETPDGEVKYIDEPDQIFIKNEADIPKIVDLAEEVLQDSPDKDTLVHHIRAYARRILDIEREEYKLMDGKIVMISPHSSDNEQGGAQGKTISEKHSHT